MNLSMTFVDVVRLLRSQGAILEEPTTRSVGDQMRELPARRDIAEVGGTWSNGDSSDTWPSRSPDTRHRRAGDRGVIVSRPASRPSRGGVRAQRNKDAFDWKRRAASFWGRPELFADYFEYKADRVSAGRSTSGRRAVSRTRTVKGVNRLSRKAREVSIERICCLAQVPGWAAPRGSMSGLVFIVRLDILGARLCFGPRLVKVFAVD